MTALISPHHIPAAPSPAPVDAVIAPLSVDRGWHPDPTREHELRFHDGQAWTDHVTHLGPVPCRGCNTGRN
ncbi:MAG: DUF2510 domain-containing protein [Actinomycetota bacterium]